MSSKPFTTLLSDITLGVIQAYAKERDVVSALTGALPIILEAIGAQAISLFLVNSDKSSLKCELCLGPVDIKGILVPVNAGLVGKAYTTRQGSLIEDAKKSSEHYSKVDQNTGFETHSILTVPIVSGENCFGCLQAINLLDNGRIIEFTPSHLEAFERLSSILGVALENLAFADQMVHDALIKRDLAAAEEMQGHLLTSLGEMDQIFGKIIPARNLSGDFIDYIKVGSQIFFCQGDVAGKGIPAALTVARCLALFRYFVKNGNSPLEIAKGLNDEIFEISERFESSGGFVTLCVGTFGCEDKAVQYINCGHGDILVWAGDQALTQKPANLPPIGVVATQDLEWVTEHIDLSGKKLFIFTDGLLEAKLTGTRRELGLPGVSSLVEAVGGLTPKRAVSKVMKLFTDSKLETSDDVTLMVIGN